MRKILLFIIFVSFFFLIPQKADAMCLTFNGKFTATNWPDASKKLEVWCKGDAQLGPSMCSGSQQSVAPNEEFKLDKCSCLVDPEGKCLQVRNLPDGCTVNQNPIACGTNGPDAVIANFDVSCPATPTPQPTTCVEAGYCEPWHTKDNIPADNPNKDKILECLDKGYYVYTKKLCSNAGYEVTCDTNRPECKIPVASPTPTDGPQCDQDCSTDPTICQKGGGGCTACVDNGSGGKTCQVPPTNTPTDSPPVSTPPVSTPPVSTPPVSTPPVSTPPVATKTPPPPTPTPDFGEAMCKCDGITATPLIPGQPATFTATSKVTGSDVTKAEAKQIEFILTGGNDPSNRQRIAGPERVNTTVSGSSTEMKYTAQWTTTIPANVQKNVEYQARATIKCTRKTTAQAYPFTAMVMGESETKGGLFAVIADFFRGLFNRSDDSNTNTNTAAQENNTSAQEDFAAIAEQNNIQLGSFAPAQIIENKCPVIRFKFQ